MQLVMPVELKPPKALGVVPPAWFSWLFYLFRAITGILACWSKCPRWQLTPISQDRLVPGNSFCEALLCFVDPHSLCGTGEVWEVVLGVQQLPDHE